MNETFDNQLRGTGLNESDQAYVLRAYLNRFTGDHRPTWVKDEEATPLQFKDDADWLANTFFRVKRDGSLDGRYCYCESHQTWPNNPELRRGQ